MQVLKTNIYIQPKRRSSCLCIICITHSLDGIVNSRSVTTESLHIILCYLDKIHWPTKLSLHYFHNIMAFPLGTVDLHSDGFLSPSPWLHEYYDTYWQQLWGCPVTQHDGIPKLLAHAFYGLLCPLKNVENPTLGRSKCCQIFLTWLYSVDCLWI